jgi:hypothetical protein
MAINKEKVIEAIRQLPDESTYEDVLEIIYVQQKISNGLQQAYDGEGISHEEFQKHVEELRNRCRKD